MSDTMTAEGPASGLDSSQARELGAPEPSSSVKTIPSDPSRTGSDDSRTGQTGTGEAGASQDGSEDGRAGGADDRSQRRTKRGEIEALREDRRELRGRVSELMRSIDELKTMQRESSGRTASRSAGTSAGPRTKQFWDDPDARFNEIGERIEKMQENFQNLLQEARESERAQVMLDTERDQAVEWVRTQKGYTPEDEGDLIDIIHENGLDQLPPMRAVRIALSMLRDERGISDKAVTRARATSVAGKPPVGGKKMWSAQELDSVLDDCIKHPEKLTPELEREIRDAQMEGRIR